MGGPGSPFSGGSGLCYTLGMSDYLPPPSLTDRPKCGARVWDPELEGHDAERGPGAWRPCKQPAGYGTTHPGYGHCKYHYGNTPSMITHGARLMIRGEARKICEARGVDVDSITPERVMMEELARAYAVVNYLESQTDVEAAMWPDWQAVMLAERKHMVAVAKMMIDAGIAERHVAIIEDQARVLGQAVRTILDRLQLTPDQRSQAPIIVREVMAALPAGSG